ncbi:hypothetical protein L1987_79309 [Smallanthus sonchifolius]|uniref:Uncharacterized protein n=1 Tax=Smallanthus sonchifolius TaxID=185202 RepID=A0ACB8ZFE5_9ASTR|nr:hypothetical protein L1987_79309 [Smallanthus sonchifolius]
MGLNSEPRNIAPNIPCSLNTDSRLSIFKHPSRRLFEKGGMTIVLTDEERHKAHKYILLNCQELRDSVWLFDEELRASFPNYDQATLDKKKDMEVARWLQTYVLNGPENAHLKDIAQGPLTYVQSHKGYLINAEDASVVGDDDNEDAGQFIQENERLVRTATEDLLPVNHVQPWVIEEVDDVNDDDHEEVNEVNGDDHEEVEFEDIDSDDDMSNLKMKIHTSLFVI